MAINRERAAHALFDKLDPTALAGSMTVADQLIRHIGDDPAAAPVVQA